MHESPPLAGQEPLNPLDWTPPRYLRRHAARIAQRHRIRRLVLLGILSLLLFGFVLADGGLVSILWRGSRVHRLESQVTRLEARQRALQQEIDLRRGDRATIERIAREEYGMVYPGERLIRIVEVNEAEARRVEAARAAQEASAAAETPTGEAH